MNLMYAIVNGLEYTGKNETLKTRVETLQNKIKKNKIKISDKNVLIGSTHYYNNSLPYIPIERDVLKKAEDVCKIRVNWKKKSFAGLTTTQIVEILKEQWGWGISVVDAEHTRNKYKNKSEIWVIYDTKEEAESMRKLFNSMFITAIEQDCIEEYKKFKENPEKRILSFDKLVSNAYDLYEAVDKGEF